jgi:hypothetical protein
MVESKRRKGFRNSILSSTITLSETRKSEIIDQLDRPNREYQEYLQKEAEGNCNNERLTGDQEHPATETLFWLQAELDAITKVYPANLKTAKQERDISSVLLRKKARKAWCPLRLPCKEVD